MKSNLGRNPNKGWSATEDTILFLMVGKFSYAQIGLRLGRSAGSVQLRASRKGWSQREEWADEADSRMKYKENLSEARLKASEEDLAQFLPECHEAPVLPHAGARDYHRQYYAEKRKETA